MDWALGKEEFERVATEDGVPNEDQDTGDVSHEDQYQSGLRADAEDAADSTPHDSSVGDEDLRSESEDEIDAVLEEGGTLGNGEENDDPDAHNKSQEENDGMKGIDYDYSACQAAPNCEC